MVGGQFLVTGLGSEAGAVPGVRLVGVRRLDASLAGDAAPPRAEVDAARETARAAARDDGEASAVALGRRVAPDGATVTVQQDGDTVVVRVRATVRGPHGLLAFLPGVDVQAEAVAAQEPG